MYKLACLFICVFCLCGCVVVPENSQIDKNSCSMSTNQKYLKIVNLNDNSTTFYEWQDEFFAIVTVPTSAIISGTYVAINNVINIGEKLIKCN
ncbi:hypothetical protein SAMN05216262_1093 [Colwellia chukchiensis]|uniref:Uncharacterized protein n=1 Tax=Colwellia chukchiensis TaxID=641665 RepID=A0A1H7P613_9GAMM|nr:hypothetical protein SAMN05216262_1093 [Colwellia chukchiensis]